MIEFQNVSKIYRGILSRRVTAVADFTLRITAGEVMGIAGPNGAGKSTLISLLLGYLRPTDGRVSIGGLPPRDYVERNGIGYMSELVAIPPKWVAEQALRRYALLAGMSDADLPARVEMVIGKLGLEEHREKRVRQLSKGNLQRLGLAQALLRDDAVVILDEPTHGLDPVWTQRFRDLVHELRRPDRAILITSHNLDELERVCDRVAIIDRGQLQRVVDTRLTAVEGGVTSYRITMASGGEHIPALFQGAVDLGNGQYQVQAESLRALNTSLSALLARGGVLVSVMPAYSALERQFREAIGEGDRGEPA
ncbi:MAG TPA: ABC transporter ATP-binding protein [Gemmatimonadaceae bacterium]|nr:ABC transporter ATP-binding protein [Gemmatimonadaceae bacterium]